MYLPGAVGQQNSAYPLLDASGTITAGGTAQLLLPQHKARSFLFIQNIDGTNDLYVEFGGARATATISNGKVTSVSLANAGFNYTVPPKVEFVGGGNSGNAQWLGVGQPGFPSPGDAAYVASRYFDTSAQKQARGTAVLASSIIAGNLISSIAISDGGAGYQAAPFVLISNRLEDPFGVAIPSATSGLWLQSGASYYMNGTYCPVDAISIFGANTGTRFTCKYAPW